LINSFLYQTRTKDKLSGANLNSKNYVELRLLVTKNKHMKHIIIGGVAGGATAAARIRRADEQAEIVLFEKGLYISYANCGLPYYIGGVIEERENLFLQTPESFGERFNVSVRIRSEVIEIDPQNKTVTVQTPTETYIETYDKLLLSPGAVPFKPPIKNIDSEGIFTLRTVSDTDAIKQYTQSHKIKHAVVIGAGFIGLEMAENLHHLGAEVSIVEMAAHVLPPIDYSVACTLHQHLNEKGVNIYIQETVVGFEKTQNGIDVTFKSGKTIHADLIILSVGVRPEVTLAHKAGLRLGKAGGIWVDKHLRTSEKDIYAVGDAIEFPHPVTGQSWLNYLAVPANRQGRIVADNMALGNSIEYEGAVGTSIAKVFDMTIAATGMNEPTLTRQNIEFLTSITHSGSNAGYYPGAMPMTIKLNFSPKTGQIYGAQIVGHAGVDKRIDQIAILLKQHQTIYDLIKIEHAYAPPYASAKDPIAIAGYVAQNIISQKMPIIHWHQIAEAEEKNALLLDVRTADEYELGTINNALNIPIDELRNRLEELPTNRPIYVFCAIGLRGYLATNILLQSGFSEVYNLSGGYKTYETATYHISNNIKPEEAEKREKEIDIDMQVSKTKKKTVSLNACGLQCPGPILKIKKTIDGLDPGDKLEISATDPGFVRDSQSWCNMTGNRLISQNSDKGIYTAVIEKSKPEEKKSSQNEQGGSENKGKTFIIFSDDLDKALAGFVLANGAASTGEKVSIFFTFWGLNVIKKSKKPKVRKDIFGKMFGMMLPSDSKKLKLSKINMFGIGSKMMRFIMKRKGIDTLESLRQQAIENGVEFMACQMSMDVMGVSQEELLDEVTIGGVAAYMERADKANVNLFI
jgi:NADPH-dependent 2,4-dienoyl-CoA reductase/sulfur reductase-like enzyme/peroxiredoxin family protein/rhodanese-related sulfurtransferase/TusA-related sulfurtransferase